jgi:hypothetical protein
MLTPSHDQAPDSQTTGNASQISPSDDALIHFIHSVRASQPSLGLPKFVEVDTSGERLRKLENLEQGGLEGNSKEGTGENSSGRQNGASNGDTQQQRPQAPVSPRRWKGRGVVIKRSENAELRKENGRAEGDSSLNKVVIPEGSDLWCEDAFIYSPIR